jgi:uncharacterized SAM-binding protein YcdF (DUF218 family)
METAFFLLSKIVVLALQVETWLAIGLMGGLFGRPRLAFISRSLTLIAFLMIGIFPLGEILLRPIEAQFPPQSSPEQVDGIVVLGGVEDQRVTAHWQQPQLNGAAERLTAAAALALRHPNAQLLFSGGSGRLSDALVSSPDIPDIALDVFLSLGVDRERITWEKRSRNTTENARFSHEVASPAPGETWVLVTSAFHMGRALASFEAAGWQTIIPHPVDYRTGDFSAGIGWNLAGNLELLNIAIKEWVGRMVYRLSSR